MEPTILEVEWQFIQHFKMSEFDDPLEPGSGKFINRQSVMNLSFLREMTGVTIIVTSAVDMAGSHGHSEKSQHLFRNGCTAIDFYFKASKFSSRQLTHYVLKSGFTGVGVYYDWEDPPKCLYDGNRIGFHGDMRPVEDSQVWKRVQNEYSYFLR